MEENLGVSGAASLMLAARRRAVGLVNEDVIVARGADHAVDRFAELIVRCARGVFGACLFATDGHALGSVGLTTLF